VNRRLSPLKKTGVVVFLFGESSVRDFANCGIQSGADVRRLGPVLAAVLRSTGSFPPAARGFFLFFARSFLGFFLRDPVPESRARSRPSGQPGAVLSSPVQY